MSVQSIEGWNISTSVLPDGSLSLFVQHDGDIDIKSVDRGQADGEGGVINVILEQDK